MNKLQNGLKNFFQPKRFQDNLTYFLNLLLGLTIIFSFFPQRQNYPLVGLMLVFSVTYIFLLVKSGELNYLDYSFFGLCVLSVLSFFLSSNTSLLNFMMFPLFFLFPFTIPLIYVRKFDKKLMESCMSIFGVIIVVQLLVFSYQLMNWGGNPDEFRGTYHNAHFFALSLFMVFFPMLNQYKFFDNKIKKIIYFLSFSFLFIPIEMAKFRAMNLVIVIASTIILVFIFFDCKNLMKKPLQKISIILFLLILGTGFGGQLITGSGWEIQRYLEFAHGIKHSQDFSSASSASSASNENSTYNRELPKMIFFDYELPVTKSLELSELNQHRLAGKLNGPMVKLAATYELITTMPDWNWWAPIIGLGPGNVNSRPATYRAKKFTGKYKPHPLIGVFKSPYTHFYHVRWTNHDLKQSLQDRPYMSSGTAETPLGSWQVIFSELGAIGILLVFLFFGTLLWMTNIPIVPGKFIHASLYLLLLVFFGVGYFVRVFEFHNLISIFWFSFLMLIYQTDSRVRGSSVSSGTRNVQSPN